MSWAIVHARIGDDEISSDANISFLSIGARPVIVHTLLALQACPSIEGIVVVMRKDLMEKLVGFIQIFGCGKVKKIVAAAVSRRVSLQNALAVVDEEAKIITLHDAYRPCASSRLIEETIASAKRYGSGVAAVRLGEPIKRVQRGHQVAESLDGDKLWCVQTPQSYKADLLREAVAAAAKQKKELVDESDALELIKKPVYLVPSTRNNLRISSPADLALATALTHLGPAT
jgi:2-C-methyl-D-erythritol 4-phosphate cytidylyltransferase